MKTKGVCRHYRWLWRRRLGKWQYGRQWHPTYAVRGNLSGAQPSPTRSTNEEQPLVKMSRAQACSSTIRQQRRRRRRRRQRRTRCRYPSCIIWLRVKSRRRKRTKVVKKNDGPRSAEGPVPWILEMRGERRDGLISITTHTSTLMGSQYDLFLPSLGTSRREELQWFF